MDPTHYCLKHSESTPHHETHRTLGVTSTKIPTNIPIAYCLKAIIQCISRMAMKGVLIYNKFRPWTTVKITTFN